VLTGKPKEEHTLLPWSKDLKGRLDEHTFSSQALKDNALGDPSDRPLWVTRLPATMILTGATRASNESFALSYYHCPKQEGIT